MKEKTEIIDFDINDKELAILLYSISISLTGKKMTKLTQKVLNPQLEIIHKKLTHVYNEGTIIKQNSTIVK